ncbi:Protein TOS1 [Metarhizium brunneum]|uniref:glucan endo-1,3-beta-D-glucosidase n=1 Tax=Metarhizium brunneum TaxID=500148 RepID=A0A7D5UXA3_9HYPO
MKYTASVLLASAGLATALIQQCSSREAVDEGGNWFCGAVDQILYEGIQGNGSFKAVTKMSDAGECLQKDQSYRGPLAPLDQDLSVHFRGPLELRQFAVYNLASNQKRNQIDLEVGAGKSGTDARVQGGEIEAGPETSKISARHRHGHRFLHRAQRDKRGDIVTATIDGKVVTWENDYLPTATPNPVPAPAPKVQAGAGAAAVKDKDADADTTATTSKKPADKKPTDKKPSGKPAPSGSDWDRVAYYNAVKQVSENIVFMGNHGGQGSGVFDTVWGLSLSYLNSTGTGGASSPEILENIRIPSNTEFSIFSKEECNGSCGFSRVPSIAYKGFGGANKVFLFEFKMPSDGTRCPAGTRPGSPGCANPDMPAVWALNAAIPRAAQYKGCSCWGTGCGELDIYEVLAPGDSKCKSTFHMANGAGSSDYFKRPTDEYIKVATVFHEETASVSIKKLSDDVDFAKGLDDETVLSWLNRPTDDKALKLSSLFQLSS